MANFPRSSGRVAVLGAGVVGLSSAVCLQQAWPNMQVELIAHKFSPNTTSDGSAGFWYPTGVTGNPDLVKKVCKTTYEHLLRLAFSNIAGEAGVQELSGYKLIYGSKEENESLDVSDILHGHRSLTSKELAKFPSVKNRDGEGTQEATSGYFFTTVQVDVSTYLQWLMMKFLAKGGKVREEKVLSLTELAGLYDLVVNCCGLGARELVKDRDVLPVRGQVLRVEAPWIKHFYYIESDKNAFASYVLPGVKNTVVGGTAQKGDWNTNVNVQDSERIWKDITGFMPQLSKAKQVGAWAGLRPLRPSIRLEQEDMDGMAVIHNYGHGGGGVTFHWGCALEVVTLAQEVLVSKGITQTKSRL